ncbi:MAG: hypothetical protein C0391_06260 [Anaerolinea sp.]|nr:hypothetical protein [Anaerolinea sp.]
MKHTLFIVIAGTLFLSGCAAQSATRVEQTAIANNVQQQIEIMQTEAVLALTPTATATPTQTPTITPTPTPTLTATPTITPTWSKRGKGTPIIAPILLYHHIRGVEKPGRYEILPSVFEMQLTYLKQWGYTSITMETLANALRYNDPLPEKPVLITFDDGDLDVYENAFPIMQRLGFVGTFYIVSNRLQVKDFVTPAQLREMIAAGWEIGSHSHSHLDLTQNHNAINSEALGSKKILTAAIGRPINSFAYPFGQIDQVVGNHVSAYGYTNAVGLGIGYTHTILTIYYLDRLEVRSEYDYTAFAKLLPWSPVSTPPAP